MTCSDCVDEARERVLRKPLTPYERVEVIGYFGALLESGHTLREAIRAIETVWADMA